VDWRVKTRSDLPGGTPLYILVGIIGFLNVTTSEKKNSFLLIETFRKLNQWPSGFDPWWPFLYVRVSKNCSVSLVLSKQFWSNYDKVFL
jgi:hypothetical protein